MSLLNPVLAFGLACTAIPIVLHLLMRARPKKHVFPALRLIQKRRRQNVRRIRLRHLWLLMLRVLVLAILVLALTRPSLPAASYGLNLRESITLTAIIVTAFAAYFLIMAHWRKQGLANHEIASRRTTLRGTVGAVGLLLTLVLIAWPYQQRVAAAITAPLPEVAPNLPVAAVFVFDTSQSMEYRLEGRTRLDEVKEMATAHLSALPRQSRIAIADSSGTLPVLFQADLAGARARIESLSTSPDSVPLNERLRAAMKLLEDDRNRMLSSTGETANTPASDRLIREIYVFTDLYRSAWTEASSRLLREELARLPWVNLYLIDAGVEQPRNVALTGMKLSDEEVSGDGEVIVEASVISQGFDNQDVGVEFYSSGVNSEPVEREQSTVRLRDGTGQRLLFRAEVTEGEILRGEVRLVASDPLSIDNRLWLTIGTRPAVRVLLVAPARNRTNPSAEGSQAFEMFNLLKVLGFDVTFLPAHELDSVDLTETDLVILQNVSAPVERTWKQLQQFVSNGGGLLSILGSAKFDGASGISSVSWNTGEAQKILPGRLDVVRRFRPACGLDVKDSSSPVLKDFTTQGVAADVALIPVWRCWHVEPAADARVLVRFTDERASAAVIERSFGKGRSAVFTTAGHLEFDEQKQWNRLPGEWPFLVLVNRLVLYLSGRTESKFNFTPNEPVILENDIEQPVGEYLLRTPSGAQIPGSARADSDSLWIDGVSELGHYLIKPRDESRPISFSVNHDPGESDFARATQTDLDNLLGEKRYSVARNVDDLTRSVTAGRLGVEVFPIILGILIALFSLELLSGNRFYEADLEAESGK